MNKELITYKDTEEYKALLEDCKDIVTEGIFASRQELIATYKNLGERISSDPLYKKFGNEKRVKGITTEQGKFMRELSRDMGKGLSTLYYAVQFVSRLADSSFSTAVELLGKNASWTKIKALLPPPPENKVELELPEGKYDLIVFDPPWNYGSEYDAKTQRGTSPYPELFQKELKKIKIPSADDCVLWLWTTHRFIWDAKELLEHYGFEYKAILVWNKEKMGIGRWLRMQTEFCLLGIKGKPKWNLTNERDIISEARREHSRKPDSFYKMVEKLTTAKRKLDMFGREGRAGWEVWGNETNKYGK